MAWFIDDLDQTLIRITNGVQTNDVPKFGIDKTLLAAVDGDYVNIVWSDLQSGTGGRERKLTLNYLDVADGYSGYINNPTSATDLANQILAMIVSGFGSSGGDILVAKGDILTHNGVSDVIHPAGPDRSLVGYDSSNADGLENYTTSDVVLDGGGVQYPINVDGVTITGGTTSADPLVAAIPAGTVSSRIIGYSPQVLGTNTTAEEILYSVLIPAGTMGAGDAFKITWVATKTTGAGNHTMRLRLHTSNAVGGTAYTTIANSGNVRNLLETNILHDTAATQVGSPANGNSYAQFGIALTTSALNTASDMYVLITSQKVTGTDSAGMGFAIVNIMKYVP